MSNKYVLAIDAGTSGIRTILYDDASREMALAYREFTQFTPAPGLLEHDPTEIWHVTKQLFEEVLEKANVSPQAVAAIGVTGQRSTVLAWNKQTGMPIYHALVWQDLRTTERCEQLSKMLGLQITPISAFTKYEWLLNQIPGCREGVQNGEILIGTLDSWLIWKLTEGEAFVTDPSNAVTTFMWNPMTGNWIPEMAMLIGMPAERLATIVPSSQIYGTTSKDTFGAHIPVAAVSGDQQAAMFGHLCLAPGQGKATYGTSVMVNVNTGQQWVNAKNCYSLAAWRLAGKDHFCLEGTVITGGATLNWIKDLRMLESVEESMQLAGSVTDSGGVYFIPALQGLGTPYMDPIAKAAVLGLTRASTRAHVARAVLEGIAFRTRQVVEALRESAPFHAFETLEVDGGMAANDVFLQMQADVLGIPVQRPSTNQVTARGIAYLAGLAVGFWSNTDEIRQMQIPGTLFIPGEHTTSLQKRYEKWVRAVDVVRSFTVEAVEEERLAQ